MVRLVRHFGRFRADRRGGILVLFGFIAPVVALGMAAVVEYTSLVSRRSQLQTAADSAAIAAAQQLRLVNTSDQVVLNVARAMVDTIAPAKPDSKTSIDGVIGDKRTSFAIAISETVPGIFGKLFSLPTMELGVRAKARLSGTTKLCLLALDTDKAKILNVGKDSWITAPGCGVYAN